MADSNPTAEPPRRAVQTLLEAKLRPPPPRAGSINRSRLVDLLEAGSHGPLTLVAAPAGYGKTTAVAQWVASASPNRAFVWVSPVVGDDDPVRFWTLLATALQRAGFDVARDVTGFVAAAADDIAKTIIPRLIEAMTGQVELSLIVDDFDRIRAGECLAQVDALIRRLPRNAHLVLITRADPALRLARLRVDGALVEVRAADLAFTIEEAAALVLREGLELPVIAVETLVQRCEGWPAGLYLAVLAATGWADPAEFIDRFSGSHRFIVDYLVEEVLTQQSQEIRSFILDLSILDRFSAPLADQLTGKRRSSTILRTLQATNLFLLPLDAVDGWFRFHGLFRLVARSVLEDENPERIPTLHRSAAEWFESNGYIDDAISHALAAGLPGEAARMAQQNWLRYYDAGLGTTVEGWLRELPTTGIDTTPTVVTAAWMAAVSGNNAELTRRLAQLDRLDAPHPLLDQAYSTESVAAMINGQVGYDGPAQMLTAAARAAELETDPGTPWYAIANNALGHALYVTGDLSTAAVVLPKAVHSASAPAVIRIQALATLSLVHAELTQPVQARTCAEEAMAAAQSRRLDTMPAVSLAYTAVGQTQAAAGHVEAAMATLDAGLTLRRRIPGGSPWPLVHHLLVMGRAATLAGDPILARAVLDEAAAVLSRFRDGTTATTARLDASRDLLPRDRAARPEIQPLTTRELRILRRLTTTLTLRQIAADLYISRNTVKTHTRSLYRKLGATSRADAIRIARDQGLLRQKPPSPCPRDAGEGE